MASEKKRYFVGGNWKSNGSVTFVSDMINNVLNKMKYDDHKLEVVVAPMIIHAPSAKAMLHSHIQIAAQNIASAASGSQTGEISADQIKDFGLHWAIVGHSERRQYAKETDEIVAAKVKRCQEHGLNAILCIGERLEERENGLTHDILRTQLEAIKPSVKDWSKIVVAYEPIWAIGTGKTASPEIAQEAHDFIRKWLASTAGDSISSHVRVIYGGSVTDSNAESLIGQKDIDGFLVGGASLTEKFATIVDTVNKHAPN